MTIGKKLGLYMRLLQGMGVGPAQSVDALAYLYRKNVKFSFSTVYFTDYSGVKFKLSEVYCLGIGSYNVMCISIVDH